jgi:hypothetical protein
MAVSTLVSWITRPPRVSATEIAKLANEIRAVRDQEPTVGPEATYAALLELVDVRRGGRARSVGDEQPAAPASHAPIDDAGLTDDELLQRIAEGGGNVVIGAWRDSAGRHVVGLVSIAIGAQLPLSAHGNEEDAMRAGKALEARMDRLAAERRGLHVEDWSKPGGRGPSH